MNTLIGTNSILPGGTVTASAETVGFEVFYAYELALTEQWKPGVPSATIKVDAGTSTSADYIGLTQEGVTSVTLEGSDDDVTYTPITVVTTPERVSMTQFTATSYRYYRATIIGASTMAILNIAIGVAVKIAGYLTAPFKPFELAGVAVMKGATTRSNLLAGRSVMFTEYPWTMKFQMIEPAWAYSTWKTLYSTIVSEPFYILWDSINYPNDALYAHLTDSDQPSYSDSIYMSLSMGGDGYK